MDATEGDAIVYCEGAFATTNGKTAHGLVRRSKRYRLRSVVDSRQAGADAGALLEGRPNGIRIEPDVASAAESARKAGQAATHMVMGLAPDGGRLPSSARDDVKTAIRLGLNVDSGLHDYLNEDAELRRLADEHHVILRDVRKPPPRSELHFFSGKIEQVTSLKVAVLGTDSAVGKRTTAWQIVDGLRAADNSAELVGTGQTAWLQGARYSIVLDTLINDFLAGEIEHAVWSAWNDVKPDVIVIEGQGSIMNPAYPGGYEILAAGRPDVVIMQHAPTRREYDGFPGYAMHPIERQIQAIELISGKPVVAITINHEGLDDAGLRAASADLSARTGLPAHDVLMEGPGPIVDVLKGHRRKGTI